MEMCKRNKQKNNNKRTKHKYTYVMIGILIVLNMICINIEISNSKSRYKTEIEKSESKIEIEIENLESEFIAPTPKLKIPFYMLSLEERKYIEKIVAGEAKGEPYEGKVAVAQCIYNSMVQDNISAVEVKSKYKYAGWDEDLETENPEAYAEVQAAVSQVFDDGKMIVDAPIQFFYAYKYSTSKWHESLKFEIEIGGHRFFSNEKY